MRPLQIFMFHRLHRSASRRPRDRGDGPVSSSVIIGGLAAAALTVVTFVFFYLQNIQEQVPTQMPGLP